MRLPPGSSVTSAAGAGEIKRTKPAVLDAGGNAPAADGVRISNAFETLGILSGNHAVKVARVAAEVQGGSYRVHSAAVGKAMVERAMG